MGNIPNPAAVIIKPGYNKTGERFSMNCRLFKHHSEIYKWSAIFLLVFIGISCNTKQETPAASEKSASGQETMAPPQVITIADLPDSLQPKTINMDTMPKPLKVEIPTKEGGFYTVKRPNGDVSKIALEPPQKKMLAVLKDRSGRPIEDSAGHTFILGKGGIADFTNYTSDNGLALDAVNCAMMDKTGNLWFGTQGGGVSRYDGKTFTTFTTTDGLAANTILYIFQDKEGNLWFGSQGGGISKYDGKSFTTFIIDPHFSGIIVGPMDEDKSGNIWFTTSHGVYKYDGKSCVPFPMGQRLSNVPINQVFVDNEGNIWFATSSGASKYDGKSFTNYTTKQGLTGNVVNWITEDRKGIIWFGTTNGVSSYDGRSFTNYTTSRGLAGDLVNDISEDNAGNLWFATNNGVSEYNGKSFTSFTIAQGLANNDVRAIIEDKTGNLWFATYGGGISKLEGNTFTSFTTAHGLPDNLVFAINQDKAGNFWFGTTDGASKYDGKSFTNFTTAQGLVNDYIQVIFEDKDSKMWFGTGGELSKYDGKSFTNYTAAQGLSGNGISGIAQDTAGNLWLGTSRGLSKYDGKTFTNYTTKQGLTNNTINTLYQDAAGNLWLGTNGGVSRFNGKCFINFSTAQGLVNNLVNNIIGDREGNIWIGTQAGLSRISAKELDKLKAYKSTSKEASRIKIDNFTTAQGLADDMVYASMEDKKGNIFIGTNLGYTVIPAAFSSLPFSQVGNKLEYYNRPNGYPVKDLNSNAMYCDSLGVMWGGTSAALIRFDYNSLQKSSVQPALILQRVKVNGENVCWFDLQSHGKLNNGEDSAKAMFQESMAYGKMLPQPDRDSVEKRFGNIEFDSISGFNLIPYGLELPHYNNQVTIEFNAVETSKPQQVEYQYILEGYDKDWSPATRNTSATFGNMYEGTYTFKVKERLANGPWSEPVTYTFKVLPPWYRTWWAYSLYVIAFGLLAFGFIRMQRSRVIAKERQRSAFREAQLKAEAENEQRRNIELISEMGKDITASLSIEHIIDTVYAHVNKLMDASVFGIGLYNKDKQQLEFPATREKGETLHAYSYQLDDTTRPANWCFNNKKEIFINDFEKEHQAYVSDIPPAVAGENSESVIYLPLINKDKSIGVITAQSFSKNAYNEYHLNVLRSLATYTAVALDNADAYRNLQITQAQLVQSEKMASLGELTAGIAHEIQNPLNFVNNFSEINIELIEEMRAAIESGNYNEAGKLSKNIEDNEEKINHHGKRADGIVKAMLQHSRSSIGVKEPVDINQLADEYLRLSFHGLKAKDKSFNAEMRTDFDASAGKVNIISQEIGRVLLNLYNNAFYAATERKSHANAGFKPTVSVSTRRVFSESRNRDEVVIAVKDNGNGIPEKVRSKIFQPFFTTKPTGIGTGLGLSLSYDVIKTHGGEINVETREGEGTEFIIHLPA
jgi:ligand-binding sensor domain-containing protein/signal transduction histidine kinase